MSTAPPGGSADPAGSDDTTVSSGGHTVGYAIASIALSSLVLVLLFVGTVGLCGTDTSYCAKTRAKNGFWSGVLRSDDGAPLRSFSFRVTFASLGSGRPVRFTTDPDGRFCIRWASESAPYVNSALHRDFNGTSIRTAWTPITRNTPEPQRCESGGASIPWKRAEDYSTSWQIELIGTLVLLGLLSGIALLILRFRGPRAASAGATSLAVSVLALVTYVAIW